MQVQLIKCGKQEWHESIYRANEMRIFKLMFSCCFILLHHPVLDVMFVFFIMLITITDRNLHLNSRCPVAGFSNVSLRFIKCSSELQNADVTSFSPPPPCRPKCCTVKYHFQLDKWSVDWWVTENISQINDTAISQHVNLAAPK